MEHTFRNGPPPICQGYLALAQKFSKPKNFYYSLDGSCLYTHQSEDSPPFQMFGLLDVKVDNAPGSREITIKSSIDSLKVTAPSDEEAKIWVESLKKAAHYKWENYYGILSMLGQGNYGKVYGGYDLKTSEQVAIKVMDKKKMKSEELALLKREYKALKIIDHKRIVKVLDLFNAENCVTAVFELMGGGSVESWQCKIPNGQFPENISKEILRDVLEGLQFCHANGLVHRDVKPANIMVKTRDPGRIDAKLIDFGFVNFFEAKDYYEPLMQTLVGSPAFTAPELFSVANGGYGPPVDIFALGVTAHLLLIGKVPFEGETTADLAQKIMNTEAPLDQKEWSMISPEAISLVKGLLCSNPNKRLTAAGALQHRWLDSLRPASDKSSTSTKTSLSRFRSVAYSVAFLKAAQRRFKMLPKQSHLLEDRLRKIHSDPIKQMTSNPANLTPTRKLEVKVDHHSSARGFTYAKRMSARGGFLSQSESKKANETETPASPAKIAISPRIFKKSENAPATPRNMKKSENAPASPRNMKKSENAPTSPRNMKKSDNPPASPRIMNKSGSFTQGQKSSPKAKFKLFGKKKTTKL